MREIHRRVLLLGLGSLLIGSAVATAAPADASSGISVFVGYADALRPNPTNFPTPWEGSPRTIFQGCSAACTYDAGAVRIVNDSSAAVTVDAVAVHVSSCTFGGWSPVVLPPASDLVLTHLDNGTSTGCAPNIPHMDTSDIGQGGSANNKTCVPGTVQPTLDVTINGSTSSYTDSGQVLNTGGEDAGICGVNESTQWTLVGTGPCRDSLFSLKPPSQTLPVLSTATLTATFTNSCGQPLSDVAVHFADTLGPNAGLSGDGVTDSSGQASISYVGRHLGTDTWGASVTNLAGTIPSNTATVTWTISFAPGGGSFVIGNVHDAIGTHVLWWGAQWWKRDPMSRGSAPASFKGFERSNLLPTCGGHWTTRPGNSSRPPASVAAGTLMAVIVADHITKSGATISGDIVHIVLVQTDPGYRPNPGHPGTGVIVAQIC